MSEIHLRHGVFMPPVHSNEENPTLAFARDIEFVKFLEELDYDEVWFGEHHSGGYELSGTPELMIAAAGQITKRIRLGTGVTSLSYHNPFMVADRIIQLDHMTRGRVMFGAGPGSLIYDALMQDIDPSTTRERMVESLDVIMRLFRGETVTASTDWFKLKNAKLQLDPYSRPYPEVCVASSKTPSGGRAAGRFGTGMICVLASSVEGFDALGTNWNIACEVAAEHGNTMDRQKLRLVAPMHLAETREQAESDVMFGLEKFMEYNYSHTPRLRKLGEGLSPIETVRKFRGAVIGTPDEAIALIERLQKQQGDFGCLLQGVHNWADIAPTRKSYELFARFVMPHFRRANVARAASLESFKRIPAEIESAQKNAISKMFKDHNEEYRAKGKTTVAFSEKEMLTD